MELERLFTRLKYQYLFDYLCILALSSKEPFSEFRYRSLMTKWGQGHLAQGCRKVERIVGRTKCLIGVVGFCVHMFVCSSIIIIFTCIWKKRQ